MPQQKVAPITAIGYAYYGPPSEWQLAFTVNSNPFGYNAENFSIGDLVFLGDPNETLRWKITYIDTDLTSGSTFVGRVIYDDTGLAPGSGGTGPQGSGAVSESTTIYGLSALPSIVLGGVNENTITQMTNINNRKIIDSNLGKNNIIQGHSGFSGHELDGTNNNVNSFIEWNTEDQTTYHRIAPQEDGQDLDIKIGFQFPSYFVGLRDSGNAFEFYGKANNGSGDGVNYLELISITDFDGTEYEVTGKQVTSTGRSMVTLTKTEIDDILNQTSSSSSSSYHKEWNSDNAGDIVYIKFKLYGNIDDHIFLDQDKAFMYIQ